MKSKACIFITFILIATFLFTACGNKYATEAVDAGKVLKESLNDPDSLVIEKVTMYELEDSPSTRYFLINYRAKNTSGGYEKQTANIYDVNGKWVSPELNIKLDEQPLNESDLRTYMAVSQIEISFTIAEREGKIVSTELDVKKINRKLGKYKC